MSSPASSSPSTDAPASLGLATCWAGGTGLVFLAGYRWTNAHAAQAATWMPAAPWDAHLPLWPWSIVPYLSLNVLLPLAFFCWPTRSGLNTFGLRVLGVMLVALFIFWHWPTANALPLAEPGWPWSMWFSPLRRFEHPVNQLPSLHIALLVLVAHAGWQALPEQARGWRWLWLGACGLIGVSTLTTWQHGTLDVLAGAVLGGLALTVPRGPKRQRDPRSRRKPAGS